MSADDKFSPVLWSVLVVTAMEPRSENAEADVTANLITTPIHASMEPRRLNVDDQTQSIIQQVLENFNQAAFDERG